MAAKKEVAQDRIRNFCIIAHIDHGKSTLADRLLEFTQVVSRDKMMDQILDDMDLERERGITIKSHAIRIPYKLNGKEYIFNLIDTPGHVDFSYEVSRSLSSCEGALLLVDAAQGIEAQTMSNMYLALDNNLEIMPVINKIDLPKADVDGTSHEIEETLGVESEDIYRVSAKVGLGIEELLEGIVEKIPHPKGNREASLQALIFDSYYDPYRGVIILVRIMEGTLKTGEYVKLFSTEKEYRVEEAGYLSIKMIPNDGLKAGEVGYIIAGIKEVADARVGDTITSIKNSCKKALPGFKDPKPMVYSGIFPLEKENYADLRDSLAKLKLNDASLTFEPESSLALGFGFRCGFLGMLHLEIVKERLFREFGVQIIATTPSVRFSVWQTNGDSIVIYNPIDLPDPVLVDYIEEPIMEVEIIVPAEFVGNIMKLCQDRRGDQRDMQYIDEKRVSLEYNMPLIEIIFDFYDKLKSVSKGYASLDYHFKEYRRSNVVKVDILINSDRVDAMSFICHESKAHSWGKSVTEKLKDVIPRQLYKVALQASIGSKVIARSTISAMRKNVTAKCYGGDITRKRKLLEKQKEGKKRMKEIGNVQVPQEAFMEVLKAERD